MRKLILLLTTGIALVVSAAACSDRAAPSNDQEIHTPDIGVDKTANTSDRKITASDRTPGGGLLRVDNASFTFCHCHHGNGPGLDGKVQLTAINSRPAPEQIGIDGLTFVPVAGGAGFAAKAIPGAQLYLRIVGEPGWWSTVTVPANTTRVLELGVYLDLPEAQLQPGQYVVHVDLLVDGQLRRLDTPTISIPLAPSP